MFIWSLSNQTWQQAVNISSAIHEETEIRLNNYLLGNVAYCMHTPKKTINCSRNRLQCWDLISCNNTKSWILRLTLIQQLRYIHVCTSATKCTTVITTSAASFKIFLPHHTINIILWKIHLHSSSFKTTYSANERCSFCLQSTDIICGLLLTATSKKYWCYTDAFIAQIYNVIDIRWISQTDYFRDKVTVGANSKPYEIIKLYQFW